MPQMNDFDTRYFTHVQSAIDLTLKRAKALESVYSSQYEDKAMTGTDIDVETEEALKMLILNLCNEIKQIFVIFIASEDFNDVKIDDTSELAQQWKSLVEKLGSSFASIRDEELMRVENSLDIEQNDYLFITDPTGTSKVNHLVLQNMMYTLQSSNSSGNEQFSEMINCDQS